MCQTYHPDRSLDNDVDCWFCGTISKLSQCFGTNQLKVTPVESQHLLDIEAFRCCSNQSVNKIPNVHRLIGEESRQTLGSLPRPELQELIHYLQDLK
jgi:hypothetical protein